MVFLQSILLGSAWVETAFWLRMFGGFCLLLLLHWYVFLPLEVVSNYCMWPWFIDEGLGSGPICPKILGGNVLSLPFSSLVGPCNVLQVLV